MSDAALLDPPTAPEPAGATDPLVRQYTELAELAGGFIHEIKNHLGTLALNLQLLGEDFQEPQNQRERRALTRVQKLQVECQRLVSLCNDFLSFPRINDRTGTPSDLRQVTA